MNNKFEQYVSLETKLKYIQDSVYNLFDNPTEVQHWDEGESVSIIVGEPLRIYNVESQYIMPLQDAINMLEQVNTAVDFKRVAHNFLRGQQ